jgi:hypothetical protein
MGSPDCPPQFMYQNKFPQAKEHKCKNTEHIRTCTVFKGKRVCKDFILNILDISKKGLTLKRRRRKLESV